MHTQIAKNGSQPKAGMVYVALGGKQNLEVTTAGRFMLTNAQPGQFFVPNINQMFFSMSQKLGPIETGVVLTGMGDDGAKGLASLKAFGGKCFVQNSASAIIDSMPKAARLAAGMETTYSPAQMASKLNEIHFGKTEPCHCLATRNRLYCFGG
jgi:chemotaxis response regulator CheB